MNNRRALAKTPASGYETAMQPRLLLPALALALAARADTILVDEQFADLNRTGDSLPGSAAWVSGAHQTTGAFTSLDASSGALLWDHTNGANNSYSGIWSYFAPAATPVTLAMGEGIALTGEVSFSGGAFSTGANAFRWGVFDSNGGRVTADFAGNNVTGLSSGTTFGAYRGYAGQSTVSAAEFTGNGLLARERTGSGSGWFISTEYADVPGTPRDEPEFLASTVYTFSLTLRRVAGGMEVQAGINGALTPVGLDATPVTEFDTLAFFTVDALTHNITLDNLRLTHLAAVPEPTTGVLLAMGAGVLARVGARKRPLA